MSLLRDFKMPSARYSCCGKSTGTWSELLGVWALAQMDGGAPPAMLDTRTGQPVPVDLLRRNLPGGKYPWIVR